MRLGTFQNNDCHRDLSMGLELVNNEIEMSARKHADRLHHHDVAQAQDNKDVRVQRLKRREPYEFI